MSVLRNAKHERFAQALASGNAAAQAYAIAGYSKHDGNAHRLSKNEKVLRRIDELRGRIAEKAEWSAADRLKMLSDIAVKTVEKDPRVAVSAIAEANKMQGSHAPTQLRHAGPGGGPIPVVDVTKVKDLDDDELDALERALVKIGAAEGDLAREAEQEERG